jgi:hypothetical protein
MMDDCVCLPLSTIPFYDEAIDELRIFNHDGIFPVVHFCKDSLSHFRIPQDDDSWDLDLIEEVVVSGPFQSAVT